MKEKLMKAALLVLAALSIFAITSCRGSETAKKDSSETEQKPSEQETEEPKTDEQKEVKVPGPEDYRNRRKKGSSGKDYVCYYGCPNSKKVKKLNLSKKSED